MRELSLPAMTARFSTQRASGTRPRSSGQQHKLSREVQRWAGRMEEEGLAEGSRAEDSWREETRLLPS